MLIFATNETYNNHILMDKTIQIYCRNNNKVIEVPIGATLEEAYQKSGLQMAHGPINAHVNNKVEGMHFRLFKQKEVEFLDITCQAACEPTRAHCSSCSAKPSTTSTRSARWLSTSPSAMATT